MKKIALLLLAMVMLIAVPCVAFDGYQGHEGQIPLCQNNKTGVLRFAPMKDIDSTTKVNYEPYCNSLESIVWINIQGIQGPTGPQGIAGANGINGVSGYEIVFAQTPIDSTPHKVLYIECPFGPDPQGGPYWKQKKALSGSEGWQNQVPITYSYLSPTGGVPQGNIWVIETYIDPNAYPPEYTWAIYGYAICATVQE